MLKSFKFTNNLFRQKHTTVNVWNEWDPLEEIIVGIPDNATVPPLSIESKPCINKNVWGFFQKNSGKYWSDVLGKEFWSKIIMEHKSFVDALTAEGVTVTFPESQMFSEKYKIYGHETTGMYCAMPRDVLLTVGNEIIEAPMTWRCRYFEINSYRRLIHQYWQNGSAWIAAPKPTYNDLFDEKSRFITNESEVTFDAADFVKAGADVFAQRSQVTNNLGIKWVRDRLKPIGIRVTTLTFIDPRPMHIDATFMPLKPGIILSNPDRKCHQEQHFIDAGWKILYAPPRLENEDHPYYLSSPWITMNVLMLDENTVIVESGDEDLQKMFQSIGLRVITVKFKHCNSIGGGFHCWTADIRRRGELKSYFDWKPLFFSQCL